MELSGSLIERVVTVNSQPGLGFTGLHGDGVLTLVGEADFTSLKWPAADSWGTVTRGGSGWNEDRLARVSDRGLLEKSIGRGSTSGLRAVRSAPVEP